ncbi:eukaryotic translation initiation factor 3 subunit g [Holotrichia oblita]|uniref:Eukaryotic translation initiation factor 3 subunit g n=2 Tax=Holotrichia oblita TaxID=644536 RepID=A0ACB9T1Z6_HOLOL|nr:eukaryotic translation initiation factor 3 subunit g [Holotrichia oblita]KAI4460809.1 eukaryotic translation initiation factor 3 subunit g [Holotrichia oblita]
MPVADEIKSSWADEVELEGGALPPSTEVRENGFKIVTDYKYNDDDKKLKIVRTYKIEKRTVSKSIALRKTWKKFGESATDKPGPNPATTIVSEDVYMQYVTSKEEDNKPEDESTIEKLKSLGDKSVVRCRTCGQEHWTTKCPWKDTVLIGGKLPDDKKGPAVTTGFNTAETGKPGGSKYVPPNMRDGAAKRTDSTNMARRDDTTAIRVSNLSESTTENDLEDLVKPFGPIQKLYLAKDKTTGACKGFAYIHFKFRNDAAKAIQALNGHGYDHLILSVDWSKPPTHSNQ